MKLLVNFDVKTSYFTVLEKDVSKHTITFDLLEDMSSEFANNYEILSLILTIVIYSFTAMNVRE